MAAELAIKITADGKAVVTAAKQAETALQGIDAQAGKTSQALQGASHSSEGLEAAMRALQSASQGYVAQLAASKSQIEAQGAKLAALGAEVDRLKEKLARPAPVLPGVAPGLDKIGISAKQTAAALRGVPAQFTDIVVSLQGGQAPLTVFLQQGGQLKDMFGGAGNAAKALGGYVMSLVNPFTVGAVVALGLAVAYEKGAGESRAFENAVTLSGNAVGLSTSQFAAMTQSIAGVAGTRGAAAAALTEIASTGRLAGTQIEAIGTAAVLMEKATGQAVSETVAQFVKLADEPVKASAELNKQYNYLTAAVYEQIKALEEQGNKLGAAELAEKSYADALRVRASSVIDNAGLMERAWRGITGAAKGAWDAMLGIGRPSTGADQIAVLEKQLSERMGRNASIGIKDGRVTQELQAQIAALKGTEAGVNANVAAQAAYQVTQKAGIAAADEIGKANERAASKQEKMNKALGDYRTNIAAIRAANPQSELLDTKKIAAAEAGIRDQYKETAKVKKAAATTGESEVARIRAQVIETQRYIDTLKSQGLESAKQTKGEKLVVKIQQELMGSLKGVARANKEKALSAAQSLAVSQKEKDAILLLLEAQRDFEKSRDKEISGQEADILKLEQKALAMEDQVRLYGMSAEAIEALSIARLQERADILAGFTGSEEQIGLIEKEISARKRLALATDGKDALDAGVKAAKEADAEWKKTATSIENTLTDSLMRAFEGGKGFAQAMRDTIVNMFKTMVLRPIIQAVMSPVSSAIGSVLGMPGAANAATSSSGVMGLANNASSLYSAITGSGLGSTAAGLVGSGVSMFAGTMAGNAALGGALGLGSGSATAAALAAAQAGGTVLTAGATTMAGSMASLGSTLAASAGPIGLAIAGVMAVSSLLAKKDSRFGGTYGYDFGGAGATYQHGPVQGATGEQGVRDAINATVTGINNLLKTVGSAASLSAYRAGLETSNKGRGGVMSGGTLSSGATFGESGQGSNYDGTYYERTSTQSPDGAAAAANFATDLKQSIIQALQAAGDVPESIAKLVRGVDAEALADDAVTKLLAVIDAQVGSVAQLRTALLALPFQNLKALSFDAAAGLIDAAGGLEALDNKLGSYYNNFFSEEEKALNTRQNIAKSLNAAGMGNISVADLTEMTRADYRTLLELQDVTTASGQAMYAALLNASEAFSSITPAIESAADKVKAARGNLIDAYKAEATAMQSTVDKFRSFATDLRSFRDGLLTGGLSPLTPGQRYAQTSSTFDQVLSATKTGTEDERIAAMGQLQGASTALLEASKIYNSSGGAYVMDFARVQEALSGAAISALATADVAQLQLDAAKSQLTALGAIDKSVLSVSSAIAALAAAQVAAGTATALPAFANGGTHSGGWAMVGERGPELAYMPPARIYTATDTSRMMGGQSASNDALLAEVRAMREESKQLREEIKQLRQQQSQETGALIQSNYDANAKNADTITKNQSKKAWSTEPVLS